MLSIIAGVGHTAVIPTQFALKYLLILYIASQDNSLGIAVSGVKYGRGFQEMNTPQLLFVSPQNNCAS